jgi:hypothetical protein
VLRKQQGQARSGCAPLFDRSIASLHLQFGDQLYVHGRRAAAREQWGQARRLDRLLSRRSLAYRTAKSYLPLPALTLGRRLAGIWRGPRVRRHVPRGCPAAT